MAEFTDYWEGLCRRNRQMVAVEGVTMRISVTSFREEVRKAFDAGVKAGKDRAEHDAPPSIFDQIFEKFKSNRG